MASQKGSATMAPPEPEPDQGLADLRRLQVGTAVLAGLLHTPGLPVPKDTSASVDDAWIPDGDLGKFVRLVDVRLRFHTVADLRAAAALCRIDTVEESDFGGSIRASADYVVGEVRVWLVAYHPAGGDRSE